MKFLILISIFLNLKVALVDFTKLIAESPTIINVECLEIKSQDNTNKESSVKFKLINCLKGELKKSTIEFGDSEITGSTRASCFGKVILKSIFKEKKTYTLFLNKSGEIIAKTTVINNLEKLIEITNSKDKKDKSIIVNEILNSKNQRLIELLAELASHKEYNYTLNNRIREHILLSIIKKGYKIRTNPIYLSNIFRYMWSSENQTFEKLLLQKLSDKNHKSRTQLIYWSKLSTNPKVDIILTRIIKSKEETEEIKKWSKIAIMNRK
ncbi:hypothetical protein [Polaribacter sp.]|uniref:hypothetical protein n=1 Tax=Polaribacter sp. TaxID=1920175 RepID=UPI003EF8DDD7